MIRPDPLPFHSRRHPAPTIPATPLPTIPRTGDKLSVALAKPSMNMSLKEMAHPKTPTDCANLLTLTRQFSGISANNLLVAAQVPVLQHVLRQHPGINPVRIARLLAETDRLGWKLGSKEFEALMVLDGFGFPDRDFVPDISPGFSGSGGGDASGGRNHGDDERLPNDDAATGASGKSKISPEHDCSHPSGKGDGLSWYSLPSRGWCQGGSLRMLERQQGSDVAMDIHTAQGSWQFYWNEPKRNCLWYLPPSVPGLACDAEAEKLLFSLLDGQGFQKFRILTTDDWIDGFNFFESDRILRHVDLVT